MSENYVMLAPAAIISHYDFQYPVVVQPKYDGVRCLLIDKVAFSRNMKPLPNLKLQAWAKSLPEWTKRHVLDGEIYAHGMTFNEIQSVVMDRDNEIDGRFRYHVWDTMGRGQWERRRCDSPYTSRLNDLNTVLKKFNQHFTERAPTHYVGNPFTFTRIYSQLLSDGYEGAMVKAPQGKYKWGRCTVNEGALLKHKPCFDYDAKIVRVVEGEGKRVGMAGTIVALHAGNEVGFGPGKGITDEIMRKLWKMRKQLVGLVGEFQHSGITTDGSLRFPKYIGVIGVTRFDK